MSVIYLKHFRSFVNEGGNARSLAFYNYLSQKEHLEVLHINLQKTKIVRLLNKVRVLFKFCFFENRTVFIHLGGLISLYSPFYYVTRNWMVMRWSLRRLTRRNTVIFEINDLPYEQAFDLELFDQFYLRGFQDVLFESKEVIYIFASYEMQKYVINRYGLNSTKCNTFINGAPSLRSDTFNYSLSTLYDLDPGVEKYVYVGTLNKGRQIEELLKVFKEINKYLILIGVGGEWIGDGYDNIRYLGAFEESEALMLTAQCDVGLIPYDNNRFYYNVCYPTKISFYLSAGIPILSTPLIESMNHLDKKGVAIFKPLDNWSKMIVELDQVKLEEMKKNVLVTQSEFWWDNILAKLDLLF